MFAEFSRRTNLNATAIRPSRLKRTLKAEKLGQVRVMNPYFFRMQISDGVVFRRVVLSPKAFGLSLLTTDFFGVNGISKIGFWLRLNSLANDLNFFTNFKLLIKI